MVFLNEVGSVSLIKCLLLPDEFCLIVAHTPSWILDEHVISTREVVPVIRHILEGTSLPFTNIYPRDTYFITGPGAHGRAILGRGLILL